MGRWIMDRDLYWNKKRLHREGADVDCYSNIYMYGSISVAFRENGTHSSCRKARCWPVSRRGVPCEEAPYRDGSVRCRRPRLVAVRLQGVSCGNRVPCGPPSPRWQVVEEGSPYQRGCP